jgi:hypothetical protein
MNSERRKGVDDDVEVTMADAEASRKMIGDDTEAKDKKNSKMMVHSKLSTQLLGISRGLNSTIPRLFGLSRSIVLDLQQLRFPAFSRRFGDRFLTFD